MLGVGAVFAVALYSMLRPPMCWRPSLRPQGVKGDLLSLNSALNEYALRHGGDYPDRLEQLLESDEFAAPYVQSPDVLFDPWRRPFLYRGPDDYRGGQPGEFLLSTLGKDGVVGGTGANQDLRLPAWNTQDDFSLATREEL